MFNITAKIYATDRTVTERDFELDEVDLYDIDWRGGKTGDDFFDELYDDDERLFQRMTDMVEGQISEELEAGNIERWEVIDHPDLEYFDDLGIVDENK